MEGVRSVKGQVTPDEAKFGSRVKPRVFSGEACQEHLKMLQASNSLWNMEKKTKKLEEQPEETTLETESDGTYCPWDC